MTDPITAARNRGVTCGQCGTADALRLVLMNSGMHYAKIVCDNCREAFVTWIPKPDKPPRAKDGRRKDLLAVIREAWEGEPLYCEVCLVDERLLPAGVWMEAHHVIEHQDGGTDSAANLRPVCNRCHALIHWVRRSFAGEQVGKETESASR